MPHKDNGKHLKLWTPATYRIEVEGHLDESWSDRLGGMRITTRTREDQTTVTTLVGRVRDQAELTGVVNSLYELHLPIFSVENLTEKNAEAGHMEPDAAPLSPEAGGLEWHVDSARNPERRWKCRSRRRRRAARASKELMTWPLRTEPLTGGFVHSHRTRSHERRTP